MESYGDNESSLVFMRVTNACWSMGLTVESVYHDTFGKLVGSGLQSWRMPFSFGPWLHKVKGACFYV
jgi:hypothetical protein